MLSIRTRLGAIAASVALTLTACTGVARNIPLSGGSTDATAAIGAAYPASSQSADQRAELKNRLYEVVPEPSEATRKLGIGLKVPARLGNASLTESLLARPSAGLGVQGRFEFGDTAELRIVALENAQAAQAVLDGEGNDRDVLPHVKISKVGPFAAKAVDRLSVPVKDDPDRPDDPVWGKKVPGTGIETGGAHVWWVVGRYELDLASTTLQSDELLRLANEAWPEGR